MKDLSQSRRSVSLSLTVVAAILLPACGAAPKSATTDAAEKSAQETGQPEARGLPRGSDAAPTGARPMPRLADHERVQATSKEPRVKCPSQDFKEFLKAFANRRDVRKTYTKRTIQYKYPYYWKYNTQPGDPRYPKWVTDEVHGTPEPDYRYNQESGEYGYIPSASSGDESLDNWSIRTPDGALRGFFPYSMYGYKFKIVKVTDTNYDIVFDDDTTNSFVMQSGCWYFARSWDKAEQELLNCKWPKECQDMREYEADYVPD